jgi:hypothetical protein
VDAGAPIRYTSGMRVAAAGAVLACGILLAARAPGAELALRWTGEHLSARLSEAPLDDVLAEIARQSAADIRGASPPARAITTEFEDVPLSEALDRLLGEESFVLVYGDRGHLREIRLLGSDPGEVRPLAPPAAPVDAASSAGSDNAVIGRAVSIRGTLARRIGASEASLGHLFLLAIRGSDRRTRASALRAWLGYLDSDPEVRADVAAKLEATDDTKLAALVSGAAGEYAEELARRLANQDLIPELRDAGAAALRVLRARDAGAVSPG